MSARRSDRSIADRLRIGTVTLLVILVAGLSFVLQRQTRSADLQASFSEGIAPRTVAAYALEESVLSLAIAVRSYLMMPGSDELVRYEAARSKVGTSLQQLTALMLPSPDTSALRELDVWVQRYVEVTEQAVAASAAGGIDEPFERQMRQVRERTQATLRAMVADQQRQADAALASVTAAERDVWRAVVGMAALIVICLLVFAWATARSITEPVRGLLAVASSLEAGNWQPALALADSHPTDDAVPVRDEMARLARAFGAAARALEQRTRRLGADRRVAAATASTLDRHALAARGLDAMAEHLQAEVGAIYWHVGDDEMLLPIAGRALAALTPVRVGDGLPGQAARERRPVVLRDIPADTPFTVRLGIDSVPPRTIVAVPVAVRDDLLGVAVLATLRPLDEEALDFLGGAANQLAIGLQNVAAHEQAARLLDDLRESNQQLQAQGEELQAQNEEIQAQSEELQAQSEELQAQNEELQVQTEEIQRRTLDIERHSDRLRANAVVLAEADERKNEFIAVLAHELRNPLAPMVTSLHLLRQTAPESETALRAQAVISRQVQHLSRLTDDLLDVTRISRGKIALQREVVDLVGVVRECVDDQYDPLVARAVDVSVTVPDAPVWVDGDRTRLCQVLSNLLSNAAKFSREGGTVAVRLTADATSATIEVIDDGAGIAPDLLPHVFDAFTQGHGPALPANGGLGLGLALVKALVELHEGTVEGRSEGPGQGARFLVRLPRHAGPATRPAVASEAPPLAARRILLIEDNLDAATMLHTALSLEGHDVEMRHDAASGVTRAIEMAPDVVLCDLGLPDGDGYGVARRLRAHERTRSALLIAVSGYAAERDRAGAADAGFDEHLAKPVTVERLLQTLRRIASRRS